MICVSSSEKNSINYEQIQKKSTHTLKKLSNDFSFQSYWGF